MPSTRRKTLSRAPLKFSHVSYKDKRQDRENNIVNHHISDFFFPTLPVRLSFLIHLVVYLPVIVRIDLVIFLAAFIFSFFESLRSPLSHIVKSNIISVYLVDLLT